MNFTMQHRGTGRVLVRSDENVWLVHYPKVETPEGVRYGYWQGYKAVEARKPGSAFYSRDNRKISPHGFTKLRDAISAASVA